MTTMSNDQTESSNLVEALKEFDTPTIANAVERLNLRPAAEGFPSVHLRCLFPELGVMCGYAVTAQVETVTHGNRRDESAFIELFETVEHGPKPAVVVMQETGGGRDRAAHSGEIMATIFSALGAIGLISDCAVRDLAAVRKLRFHYFARGSVSSHANFRIVRSNVPVEILGMTVHPGDLLHGDENGIVSVPPNQEEALQRAVREILGGERELMEFARQRGFTSSMLRNRFLH